MKHHGFTRQSQNTGHQPKRKNYGPGGQLFYGLIFTAQNKTRDGEDMVHLQMDI